MPLTVEVWSLNHWIASEVSLSPFLISFLVF